ncbi:MAG: ferredoxin [Angustibacter sp.]
MSAKIAVDWPKCAAHGLCHELVPELIDLDDWGYPIITGKVTRRVLPHVKRAVAACPTLALRLQANQPGGRRR